MTPRAHTAERLQRGTNSTETPYRSLIIVKNVRFIVMLFYTVISYKKFFFIILIF